MRIFYASDTTPNAQLQSNLWRNNLYMPLLDLGHEVIEFDYDMTTTFQKLDPAYPEMREFIAINRPKLTQALLEQIKAAHAIQPIDLFFSYFYDACVFPEAIDEIKAMGIVTVNWYCNGSYQLHLVREISPHYDYCLVPEKFRLKDYQAMGARPIYCQEAANPNIYKPYDLPKEFDVTFVGQAYGERPAMIRSICDAGIDIRVWGFGWKNYSDRSAQATGGLEVRVNRIIQILKELTTKQGWIYARRRVKRLFRPDDPALASESRPVLPDVIIGDPLSDLEMIQLYSRSKINLGFSSVGDTHKTGERIVQVRLRDFEIPMSGGFYMVEYMEELEEFFEIGKEIVCYSGVEDLIQKIRYYLAHDEEREAIRHAGYARCQRDHTWHRRFEMSFAQMNLRTNF